LELTSGFLQAIFNVNAEVGQDVFDAGQFICREGGERPMAG
jgi:hypothetical protein